MTAASKCQKSERVKKLYSFFYQKINAVSCEKNEENEGNFRYFFLISVGFRTNKIEPDNTNINCKITGRRYNSDEI